jgi:ATP-binding protein involved in chromosome partitioning
VYHHAIAVASGKGGVGKSTEAYKLAASQAHLGARVGLMDADIYGPNIPTMMGVEQLPPAKDGKISPAEAYGVKFISIGFLVKRDQPLIWRGPMLHSAIRQFVQDVHWGEIDYLIIDLPPGTGDASLSVAQTLPLTGGVIVTLPQQVSLDDARRGLEMFRQLDVPIFGVVENMSYLELPDGSRMDIFGAGGGERLANEAGVPYMGAVPMDPAVREGGDGGKPIVATHPDTPVAKALANIAEEVLARINETKSQDTTIPIQIIG